jgi:tetrahydromethanopterin S-methyltransferase subunit G
MSQDEINRSVGILYCIIFLVIISNIILQIL